MNNDLTIKRSSRRNIRRLGLLLISISLITTAIAFAILMDLTPIVPDAKVTNRVVWLIAVVIGVLSSLVAIEIYQLWRARQKRRVAARLHIRIVSLFAVIAAIPAVIVAVVASITLDRGLDRWFSDRTNNIVGSSITVARSYLNEHARFLIADMDAVAKDFDRVRFQLLNSEVQTIAFLNAQARIRNIPLLKIVDRNGKDVASADSTSPRDWPKPPQPAIENAASQFQRIPILIRPGSTANLVGGIVRLSPLDDQYLYGIREVDPQVINYLREAEKNAAEYTNLQNTRTGRQIAFALLYLGVALVLLISSIWVAINFADRIVNPIRNLMTAANAVSEGDLSVQVPVRKREGDIGILSESFNTMTSQLSNQRAELLDANDQLDVRRRFIEAVLSGVSAGVVGLSTDGKVEVINRFGLRLFDLNEDEIVGKMLGEIVPELATLTDEGLNAQQRNQQSQISLVRRGMELTVNVGLTSEYDGDTIVGYVLTLDDITDLVKAQRTSAWADIARRIAHEIKNPLTPIQLSAERLRRRFGKDLNEKEQEVFDKCTNTIVRQVGDIGRMVDEFSSFARMPKPTFTKGDLRECLKEAIYVREVAQPDIAFTIDLPEEPMIAYFDERLISQAITNLVKNAGEAVETVTEDGEGQVHLSAAIKDDLFIIEIIDNGKGWPQENRHKLLEPYMTTRKKGTGLGLAIVAKVVEDHKGRLELLDAPQFKNTGRGAVVRITFPSGNRSTQDIKTAAE